MYAFLGAQWLAQDPHRGTVPVLTTHGRHVTPGLEVRAHHTPMQQQIDDEEQAGRQQDRRQLVVVHEAGQSADVHVRIAGRVAVCDQGKRG